MSTTVSAPPRHENQSDRFRRDLSHELGLWVDEGLVSADEAGRLAQRYRVAELAQETSQLALRAVFIIGGLLLGLGLVSFVAYNWASITALAKSVLLIGGLITLNAAGYWLWFKKGMPGLGHSLVFAGCLLFGADIALMAQSYHISSSDYVGYGAWAVGCLAMAYVVRSLPIAFLSFAVACVWLFGPIIDGFDLSLSLRTREFLSFAASGVAFGAFAAGARSRFLMFASAFLLWFGGAYLLMAQQGYEEARWTLPALIGWTFLIWSVGPALKPLAWAREAASGLEGFGAATFAFLVYVFSFHGLWENMNVSHEPGLPAWVAPVFVLAWPLALGITVLSFRKSIEDRSRNAMFLAAGALGSFLLACLVCVPAGPNIPSVVLAVAASFLFGAAMVANGIWTERRESYWVGVLYLVSLVLARMFEYETSLATKALAFVVCGAALIAAGACFEGRRKPSGEVVLP